jgi:hypothetical protein
MERVNLYINKELVLNCCRAKLKNIYWTRNSLLQTAISNTLKSRIWWYEHFYKWISFGIAKRPTKEDIVRKFFSGSKLTNFTMLHYESSEAACKELLHICIDCKEDKIWVSPETIFRCDFGTHSLPLT